MDLMRLLKSVEELLYELATWMIFYPLTLWRCIVRPARMMRYADVELSDNLEDQYSDALSPPIFLLITILIAHLVEVTVPDNGLDRLPAFFADEYNLILFRAILFSLFPLIFAFQQVRTKKLNLTRRTLKPYFYAQCFVVVPFVLAVDLSVLLVHAGIPLAGAALAIISLAWYTAVQIRWFMAEARISAARASGTVLGAFAVALFLLLLLATLAVAAIIP